MVQAFRLPGTRVVGGGDKCERCEAVTSASVPSHPSLVAGLPQVHLPLLVLGVFVRVLSAGLVAVCLACHVMEMPCVLLASDLIEMPLMSRHVT